MFSWHEELTDFCRASIDYLEAAAAVERERRDKAQREQDSEWVALVMAESLLLKAAQDLRAVMCLEERELTGPIYAASRSLFEALVDMLYLVHDDATERRARNFRILCCSIAEDGCARYLAESIRKIEDDPQIPDYDSLHSAALVDTLAEMRSQISDLVISDEEREKAEQLLDEWQTLAVKRGRKALIEIAAQSRPSMAKRLAAIRQQHPVPAMIKNLEFSYRVLYAQASAFVHSSGGMYLAGRGRPIELMPAEPASFVVLVSRDIIRVCEPMYQIELPELRESAVARAEDALNGIRNAAQP